MKTPLSGLLWLLTAFVLLSVCPAGAQEKKPDKKTEASIWMTRKLELSQKILAGLTKADFPAIKKAADGLRVVTYLEEWDRGDMPEYKRQLRYFADANKELIRQSDSKNINGATLAYTQVMLSCVHCHNIVRDVKKK